MSAHQTVYSNEVESILMVFDCEYCENCGKDLDRHSIAPDPLGHAHLFCLDEPRDDESPAAQPKVWIEYTDGDGYEGAGRWNTVTEEQLDAIIKFATDLLGQPDTVA